MSWYRTGTVAVTNGSKTVTGVGTLFTTAVNAGDAFALVDANLNPTGAWYEVEAVVSNTEITLKQSYAGTTGSNKQYCVFNMVGNMTTPSFAQRLATFFASFQSLIDKPTTTPTAASIPVADANGKIDSGWIKDASETVKGVVELATSAEVLAGVDTERAVTPNTLLGKLRNIGLSGGISNYTTTNANDLPLGRFVYANANNNILAPLNYPDIGGETPCFWLVFTNGISNRTIQIAIQAYFVDSPMEIWVRKKHDTRWSPWARSCNSQNIGEFHASETVKGVVELATSAEVLAGVDTTRAVTPATLTAKILGTVSQVGGVPTGAVIESGSNANGTYVKFADGTMMCSYTDQIGKSVNTTTSAWGPSVSTYYADVSYTYPASFFSEPNVAIASIDLGSGVCSACLNSMPTTTSVTMELIGSCALVKSSYIAIGRWY